MPQFDNRKAAGVWQRVHAAPETQNLEQGRILALIPALQECAHVCASNKELSASFRKQAAALRGIYTLLTGEKPAPAPGRKSDGLSPAALRKCYAAQLRTLSECQALCGSPDFGPALQALIPLAQNTCLTLLALLGG